jgi:hypothetical protein
MAATGMAVAPAHLSFFDRSTVVAIYRFLQHSAFAPEDIAPLVAAYEDCLRALKLSDRSDPITEMLAKKDHRARANRDTGFSCLAQRARSIS